MPYFKGNIEKVLEKSKCFIDVGAHSGMYLDVAKENMKKGVILAFDPNLWRISKIKKLSLFLKNLKVKIKYIKKVVTNKKGELYLYKDTISREVKPKRQPSVVNSVILDDYLNEKNIETPDVIKIDVEGGEFSVLDGCKKIISKNKTHFFIEIHDEFLRKQGLDSKDIFSYFDPKKYKHKILFIKDGKPLERNPFESEMKLLKEKGLTESYLKPGNIVRKTRIIYIHFIPRLK